MLNIGRLSISDDLTFAIGRETVRLRPAQGLRAVEKLLRASTRLMMVQESTKAAAQSGRPAVRKATPKL